MKNEYMVNSENRTVCIEQNEEINLSELLIKSLRVSLETIIIAEARGAKGIEAIIQASIERGQEDNGGRNKPGPKDI